MYVPDALYLAPFPRYSLRHVKLRYSLFIYPLAFNPLTEGFPWDDLREMLHVGQRMARVQCGVETLTKFTG